jgi:hypothetical protein
MALEQSADAMLEQAERDALGLLSDAELERLAEKQERQAWAEIMADWRGMMVLSDERKQKSERLQWLQWLRDMSKAISQG